MRSDAANLLSRLGQNSFKYKEFRDNFADMELWPLFEALIRDPRISGEAKEPGHGFREEAAPVRRASADPAPTPVATPARPGGLFGRYEETPAKAPDDVRSLLRQLNDRVQAGEL
jgi:hypothetical protein